MYETFRPKFHTQQVLRAENKVGGADKLSNFQNGSEEVDDTWYRYSIRAQNNNTKIKLVIVSGHNTTDSYM